MRRLAWMLVVVLAVAACSDGSAEAEDLPPVPSSESTSTDSVTTSSSTTQTTATTSTSTTSTTLAPDAKPILEIPTEWPTELDEIFGRYLLYWDALYIALGPPEADANYAPLKELVSAGGHEDLVEQADAFREKGHYVVLPDNTITEHQLRLPNPMPLDKTEGNEVVIQDCWVDDSEIRTESGALVTAYRESILRNVKMEVIDGEWRVSAARDASEDSSGYVECTDLINQL